MTVDRFDREIFRYRNEVQIGSFKYLMSHVIFQIEAQKALISKIFFTDKTNHQTGSFYHWEAFTMLISFNTYLLRRNHSETKKMKFQVY